MSKKVYYQVHVVLFKVVEYGPEDDFAAHEYDPEGGTQVLEEEEPVGYRDNFESETEARKVFSVLTGVNVE